jgi:signal transduction histidine kinase
MPFPDWFRRQPSSSPLTRRAVDDLVRSLALIVDPAHLRISISSRVRELVGCESVIFCQWRGEHETFAAACWIPETEIRNAVEFRSDGSLCRWLRVNPETMLVPHPKGAFESLDEGERAVLTGLHARACVPISSGTRIAAILVLCASTARWQVTAEHLDLLARISAQVGLALENAELQQLERDRLQSLHRAGQLAVAGQLAATVAHEIRNPLTAIRSTVQYVLESSAAWDTKAPLLQQILNEVDRIERTVGGVLAISRQPDAEQTELDLVATGNQALLLVQGYAQAHGISIERLMEIDMIRVRGNPRSLHQVCVNLLLNACQAMPSGGRLTIRCATADAVSDSGPHAILQIRDTGVGIAAGDLQRVFDPFYTTKTTGTGLGLTICHDIVTKHQGQLKLESEPGRGTVATVLLPLSS